MYSSLVTLAVTRPLNLSMQNTGQEHTHDQKSVTDSSFLFPPFSLLPYRGSFYPVSNPSGLHAHTHTHTYRANSPFNGPLYRATVKASQLLPRVTETTHRHTHSSLWNEHRHNNNLNITIQTKGTYHQYNLHKGRRVQRKSSLTHSQTRSGLRTYYTGARVFWTILNM